MYRVFRTEFLIGRRPSGRTLRDQFANESRQKQKQKRNKKRSKNKNNNKKGIQKRKPEEERRTTTTTTKNKQKTKKKTKNKRRTTTTTTESVAREIRPLCGFSAEPLKMLQMLQMPLPIRSLSLHSDGVPSFFYRVSRRTSFIFIFIFIFYRRLSDHR